MDRSRLGFCGTPFRAFDWLAAGLAAGCGSLELTGSQRQGFVLALLGGGWGGFQLSLGEAGVSSSPSGRPGGSSGRSTAAVWLVDRLDRQLLQLQRKGVITCWGMINWIDLSR